MKKPSMLVVAILLACGSLGTNAQGKSPGSEEFAVNGLKVILKSVSANDIISVQLYLRGGALNLTEATQGIESLIFQCAAKGSTDYPKEKLNTILDKTASVINSNATKDFSVIGLRCLKSDFDKVWDAYADVVMHPAFVSEDVEVVRNNALLAIKQRKDTPDGQLRMVEEELFYAGHPYRLDPDGVETSISSFTIEQMKKYLKDNLVTSKLLLVVVGNVSKEALQKKVAATLGMLPSGQYKATLPAPVVHNTSNLKVVERQLPTTYFQGSFAMPGPSDPDFHTTLVMMNILATRVWEEVRTKRNLSYAPSAGLANRFANQGFIYVTAVNPDSAVKVMIGELKKIQEEPVSAKDLKDRIAMFLTRYNLTLETNESQGGFLAFHELSGMGWQAAAQFVDRARKVTAADIQRVAKKYFHNMQSTVIGDPKLIDKAVYEF
jgi:zinc protease